MRWLVIAWEYLFGCHHHQLSRVFTIGGQTYCVCFDCGARFDYSLATMQVLHQPPPTRIIALNSDFRDRRSRPQKACREWPAPVSIRRAAQRR